LQIRGWTMVVAVLGAAGLHPSLKLRGTGQTGRVVLITPAALQRLSALGLAQPIDLRTAGAFRAGHIPGAIHVTPDRIDQAAREIRSAAGARTVVTYGARANDVVSEDAALWLRALGFPDVASLAGGFAAWTASGGPIASAASGDHFSAAASVARNFLNASSVSTMSWPRIR